MVNVLVCTDNSVKLHAVVKYFKDNFTGYEFQIDTINCESLQLPAQLVNCGLPCTQECLSYAKTSGSKKYQVIIAIEYDLTENLDSDNCHVLVEYDHRIAGCVVSGVPIPEIFGKRLRKCKMIQFNEEIKGYDTTIGELIQQENPEIDANNWTITTCRSGRVDIICNALDGAFIELGLLK